MFNILNNHYNHKNNHNLVLLHKNIRLDLIIYYLFCILMHIEFYAKEVQAYFFMNFSSDLKLLKSWSNIFKVQ